ncbi:hypothetical protein HPULCUR_007157 [Helicostylum pulchrum]|uniref:DNA mismatch repair protein S5 domain-containing protein n=1 Tax=Helicostylum pulchrum TaxID=562976 RepID=A0ABP9Y3Y7_9FUNG
MTIKVLDSVTVRSIHSGQVIVDLEAIVKELLENSLDAHSTSIEFMFVNNGLESVNIKDNGDGIEEQDRLYVAKQHYTSKIIEFQDLEKIQTYGFRGEAINAICSVSDKMTIVTKTKHDIIAKQYDIDKEGSLSNEKVSNTLASSGTIITLYKPFYNLPVRRQLAQKNAANNMKKVQDLLTKYALAHPKVRFSYTLVKETVGNKNDVNNTWIKPVTPSIEKTILHLFGAAYSDMLERFIETDSTRNESLTIDAILPKPDSDPSIILKGPERIYFYVNQRPIDYAKSELKEIVTSIRNRYREAIGLTENTSKKTPFIYIDIQLPPNEFDVNIEPNKTTVLFHNKELVFNLVKNILDTIYPNKIDHFFTKTPVSQVNVPPIMQRNEGVRSDDNNRVENNTLGNKASIETWQIDNASDSTHASEASWRPINRPTAISHTNHQTVNNTNSVYPQKTSVIPKKRPTEPDQRERITKYTKTYPAVSPELNANTRADTPSIPSLPSLALPLPPPPKDTVPAVQSTTISSPKPRVSLPPQPKARRDITSLLNRNKTTTRPPNVQQLCNTLNQSLTIDCDLEDIKKTYPKRKEILSETYRIRIEDYLSMNDYGHAGQVTRLLEAPAGLDKHGLSFYTRGNPSVLDQHRHQIYQLGVVKLKALYINDIVNKLVKERPLVCKKTFDRPIQIKIHNQDRLCPVLFRLKTKESYVEDDMHGCQKTTYSEIVDYRIVNNGFRVRWRKDLVSNNLVIQFTGIYTLGTGYGTSDFRELLSLMMESKEGEFVRPKKVIQYYKSLAEEIYINQPVEKDLETALDNLIWKESEDEWKLGYSAINEQLLACMMISSQLLPN